jgi:hypothetical protein
MLVRETDRASDGEGEQCLIHLLSSHVETWGSGERKTIGEKISEGRRTGAQRNEINAVLGRCGLKLAYVKAEGGFSVQALLVARRHQGLERIFQGTRWGGAVWRQALEDLPGAQPWATQRFAGSPPQRCSAEDIEEAGSPVASAEDLGMGQDPG